MDTLQLDSARKAIGRRVEAARQPTRVRTARAIAVAD
jgi:hypothetical protein